MNIVNVRQEKEPWMKVYSKLQWGRMEARYVSVIAILMGIELIVYFGVNYLLDWLA